MRKILLDGTEKVIEKWIERNNERTNERKRKKDRQKGKEKGIKTETTKHSYQEREILTVIKKKCQLV